LERSVAVVARVVALPPAAADVAGVAEVAGVAVVAELDELLLSLPHAATTISDANDTASAVRVRATRMLGMPP
jgi:hypothetical protein